MKPTHTTHTPTGNSPASGPANSAAHDSAHAGGLPPPTQPPVPASKTARRIGIDYMPLVLALILALVKADNRSLPLLMPYHRKTRSLSQLGMCMGLLDTGTDILRHRHDQLGTKAGAAGRRGDQVVPVHGVGAGQETSRRISASARGR